MIRKLSAMTVSVGIGCALVACGTDEPAKTYDPACIELGHYLLKYNLMAVQDRGEGIRATPKMIDYLQPDGRLLPFADALNANNPGKSEVTGRVQLGEVFTNYLVNIGVPVTDYEMALHDAANATTTQPLDLADLHYLLAARLGVPTYPPAAFDNGNAQWRTLDGALGDDPAAARDLIRTLIDPVLAENEIPVDAFVDAYNDRMTVCKPQ